jgi:hypothetical protein
MNEASLEEPIPVLITTAICSTLGPKRNSSTAHRFVLVTAAEI